jgi:hypothetical protein
MSEEELPHTYITYIGTLLHAPNELSVSGGRRGRKMVGWIDRWMDVWMDGWIDG